MNTATEYMDKIAKEMEEKSVTEGGATGAAIGAGASALLTGGVLGSAKLINRKVPASRKIKIPKKFYINRLKAAGKTGALVGGAAMAGTAIRNKIIRDTKDSMKDKDSE